MQQFRIINLLMQSAYLIGHFLFIVRLYRERQPTPIWRWFFAAAIAMWIWVSGRFMETIVYLFYPSSSAYVFAANYQYIGNTTAVVSYVIWILFLSGYDRLASSTWFRAFLFACPVVICTLVFTNQQHHLFYTRLIMGERVSHGPLFVPCVIWTFLILLAGYIVSVQYVLRAGIDKIKQIIMFSLFPIVPALGVLVRTISGVDRVDYTPIVMAVSMMSLYQIIFRHHYVNIISASVRAVIEQTDHPIIFYARGGKEISYVNRIAREQYPNLADQLIPRIIGHYGTFEETCDGRHLTVDTVPFEASDSILAAATDVSDIVCQHAAMEQQIAELETLRQTLEEANRNIDAYLGSLYDTKGVQDKQELISGTYSLIRLTFRRVEENLQEAKRVPDKGADALRENLILTRDCIGAIRKTVAQLKEG